MEWSASKKFRSPSVSHDLDDEPILMGEVPSPGTSASASPARKSNGGVTAFLGLLIPVALGGATVFGVYFLFLKDLLNPPAVPANAEQSTEAVKDPPAPNLDFSKSPSSPAIVNRPAEASDSRATPEPLPRKPGKSPEEINAERETAAQKALGLARQMSAQNPRAAGKWYRKVIEDYPGTGAADEAQSWLKKQAGEP
jgi:hypothetical protein